MMEILDAGRLAPTAGNCQPWQFVVVNDRAVIAQLKEAALGRNCSIRHRQL
jgi:nitroreductase